MSQPNSIYPPTGYANHVEPEVVGTPASFGHIGDLSEAITFEAIFPELPVAPAETPAGSVASPA